MSGTWYKKHNAGVLCQPRTIQGSCSRYARLPTTARPYTLLVAVSPALLWLRPTKLLHSLTAEARLAALVGPAQLTVQPVRIAARLFQRRDERCTSRRWREARRPSPSPRHEHTARTRNPKSGTPVTMERRRQTRPMHTLLHGLHVRNVHFPLLGFGVWGMSQGELFLRAGVLGIIPHLRAVRCTRSTYVRMAG